MGGLGGTPQVLEIPYGSVVSNANCSGRVRIVGVQLLNHSGRSGCLAELRLRRKSLASIAVLLSIHTRPGPTLTLCMCWRFHQGKYKDAFS